MLISHGEGLVAPGPVVDDLGRTIDTEYGPIRLNEYYMAANHRSVPIEMVHHAWTSPGSVACAALSWLSRNAC
jgi:hypothetical protein